MAWYDHLEYGDPVVCVDASLEITTRMPFPLKTGKVYIFVGFGDISLVWHRHKGADVNILLKETVNPWRKTAGFSVARFRPAQTSDLPASIREALKTPAPKEKVNV